MIWFGSSAGVALANLYPQARSVGAWLRSGWHVAVGYVLGYVALVLLVGWDPVGHGRPAPAPAAAPPAVSTTAPAQNPPLHP